MLSLEKLQKLADIVENINMVDENIIDSLKEEGYLDCYNQPTSKALEELEPYRVKRAIIIAAGFGSRMVPITYKTPKPLVLVNGVRIIDTLLDALTAADISDINIVIGYKKEQFLDLLKKYPNLNFIENDLYDKTNNISSIYKALDLLDNTYICEADLILSNKKIIRKYQFNTNYLGFYVDKTSDWCFKTTDSIITKTSSIGGDECYQMIGISYWSPNDSKMLKRDLKELFEIGNTHLYWDNVALTERKENYKIKLRKCLKSDVVEIDTFDELCAIDSTYITL